MKTAEDIIDEIQSEVSMGPFEYLDYKDCIRAMKSYASEIVKEVLKRAAENAMLEPDGMMLQVDKDSILNTEYQDLLK